MKGDIRDIEVETAITVLGALATAGAWFSRRVWLPFFGRMKAVFLAPGEVADIGRIVRKELTPNGGNSMLDRVLKTSVAVEELKAVQAKTNERLSIVEKLAILNTNESALPIWRSDAHGRCVFISDAFEKLTGWRLEEIEGDGWRTNIIPQSHRQLVEMEWDSCILHKRDFNYVYPWICKDGRVLEMRCFAHRVLNGEQVIGWIGVGKLLGEHK